MAVFILVSIIMLQAYVFDKAFQAAKKGDLTGISVLKELQQFDYDVKNEAS